MALVMPAGARHVEGEPTPIPGRPGLGSYAGGDAAGVGRAVSARVAKMSSMSRIPWGVMPIVC